MKSSVLRRGLCVLTLAVVSIQLIACAPASISGKVIEGELSTVLIVDRNDERLKADGVYDASVKITANYLGANPRSHRAKTNEKGRFGVSFGRGVELRDPMRFEVRTVGYVPAMTTTTLPTAEQKLLVILKPLGPQASNDSQHLTTTGTP